MKAYVWTPEAEERVAKALEEGWSQRKIARTIGCSAANVNKVAQRIRLRQRCAEALDLEPKLSVKLTDEQRAEQRAEFRAYVLEFLVADASIIAENSACPTENTL